MIPRNAAEMPTAASKSLGSRLPSRGLLLDHYQKGPLSGATPAARIVPVEYIARRQAQAEFANAQWQDEALKARSSRFAGITGHRRKGAFQSTIPSTLESAEEKEGWSIVEEGGGARVRVHYLKGGSVYNLVFGFLKKHERHIHLLGYDNAAFREAPGKWEEKFGNIGLDLLGGELRVVMGERGSLCIVKGDALEDVQSEVHSEVTGEE